MIDKIKRWRRRLAEALRTWAGRVDPGWPLPAQYTTEHVMRYRELMIDVGLADAYDASVGGDGAPAMGTDASAGGTTDPAPPPGARHEPGQSGAAQAMKAAQGQVQHGEGISAEQAMRIRRAFIGELDRLNMIILDIDEDQAGDVPVDVTVQALRHFVPVYVGAMIGLTGTSADTA